MNKLFFVTFSITACVMFVSAAFSQTIGGTLEGGGASAGDAAARNPSAETGSSVDVGSSLPGPASMTDSGINTAVGIAASGRQLPANTRMLGRGDIIRIDRENNSVTVRDSNTGSIMTRSIHDSKMLLDLNQGDSVQIYHH